MIRGIRNEGRRAVTRTPRLVGFSLIEILVVMVILLIGVLAILRLFPGGFLTIQRTAEMTAAGSLASQQVEAAKNSVGTPESILAVRPDPQGNLTVMTDAGPDDLPDYTASNNPVPGVDPAFLSNINQIRFVKGEPFSIPIANPSRFTTASGAIAMLQYGPVFNRMGSNGNGFTDSLNVYGAPLERTEQPSIPTNDQPDARPQLRNESQYAIDYANLRIAFYPRTKSPARPAPLDRRTFLIQYDYYTFAPGGGVRTKSVLLGPSTTFIVPDVDPSDGVDPNQPIWMPLFNISGSDNNSLAVPTGFNQNLGIRRGSEDVSRRFRLVQGTTVKNGTLPDNTPTWTDDPYEYAWFSEQKPNSANAGVLIFNPLGRNTTTLTSSGTQPFMARVDYMTFDNHIVRDDRSVPNAAPYDIKLSLPFVLTEGDKLDDQASYNGLFRDANSTPSILVYDANRGIEVGKLVGRCIPNVTGPDFTVDPQSGTLRLNASLVQALGLQSANLRIFYRAAKDWGMQVQKAHARYYQETVSNVSDLSYRGFYVGGSNSGVGATTRLYFPISEAGKTVVLGEYYVSTNIPVAQFNNPTLPMRDTLLLVNNVVCRRFTNEAYQLSPDKTAFDSDLGRPYLDLVTQHSIATSEGWAFTDAPSGRAVNNVQGASLKSRVIWHDGSRRQEDPQGNIVFLPRWRKIDNDTVLMKTLGR